MAEGRCDAEVCLDIGVEDGIDEGEMEEEVEGEEVGDVDRFLALSVLYFALRTVVIVELQESKGRKLKAKRKMVEREGIT